MKNIWFQLNEVDQAKLKYAVILAKHQGQFILIRHQNRLVWELPGGKREAGETIIEAACRELYEETGAVHFNLTPFGIYFMNGRFGMIFIANIQELRDLPDYEIAEIRLSSSLPTGLNYGELYYDALEKWEEVKADNDLKTYPIRIQEKHL